MPPVSEFNDFAQALGALWMNPSFSGPEPDAELFLGQVPAALREQLRALSDAYQALRLSCKLQAQFDSSQFEQAQALTRQGLQSPCVRVRGLSLAAEVRLLSLQVPHARERHVQTRQDMLELLPLMPADWPKLERVWTEFSLSELEAMLGDSDAALERILRLDQLPATDPTDHLATLQVRTGLVSLLLSACDVEAAIVPARRLALEFDWPRHRPHSFYYNYLLALGLAGQFDEATSFLSQHPEVREVQFWAPWTDLHALIQWLETLAQRREPDLAWLAQDAPAPSVMSRLGANVAWMKAEVALRAGLPQRAVELVQQCLQASGADSATLTPLNGTRLFSALSQAYEAQGNAAAALDALRQALAHAQRWALRSTGARLVALHLAAPGAPRSLQQQRLQALRQEPAEGESASRLVAHVSHELRNPLNGVLGMIGLLRASELNPAQRRQLELADSSARTALTLCNDLLDLAKVDAGRLELAPAPCQVMQVLDEVVQLHMPRAQTKGLQLRLEVGPELTRPLQLDRLRLQQVVVNLLSNAIKFTQRGEVLLGATWQATERDQGVLKVEVVDTGVGIAAQDQDRLFREFTQLGSDAKARQDGSGLGLALSRKLVVSMGGRISHRSEPGKGSSFWIELPCTAPPADDAD